MMTQAKLNLHHSVYSPSLTVSQSEGAKRPEMQTDSTSLGGEELRDEVLQFDCAHLLISKRADRRCASNSRLITLSPTLQSHAGLAAHSAHLFENSTLNHRDSRAAVVAFRG